MIQNSFPMIEKVENINLQGEWLEPLKRIEPRLQAAGINAFYNVLHKHNDLQDGEIYVRHRVGKGLKEVEFVKPMQEPKRSVLLPNSFVIVNDWIWPVVWAIPEDAPQLPNIEMLKLIVSALLETGKAKQIGFTLLPRPQLTAPEGKTWMEKQIGNRILETKLWNIETDGKAKITNFTSDGAFRKCKNCSLYSDGTHSKGSH